MANPFFMDGEDMREYCYRISSTKALNSAFLYDTRTQKRTRLTPPDMLATVLYRQGSGRP